MKIFVYEWITGGGFRDRPFPFSLLVEGYSMLEAIVNDFCLAGHETTVLLDGRLRMDKNRLSAENILFLDTCAPFMQQFDKLVAEADATYIIAPETAGILERLVKRVQGLSQILNCTSEAIKQVAGKDRIHKLACKTGLTTPSTITIDLLEPSKEIASRLGKLGYPIIMKPVQGTGCEGISIIECPSQIEKAIKKIRDVNQCRMGIAQKYVNGISASVSLLISRKIVLPLSLNGQNVKLSGPGQTSRYLGGFVPLEHHLREKACDACIKLIKGINGLQGYVGIDIILTEEEVIFLEINPRLTTSYIGLRQVLTANLAQLIIDSIVKNKLPKQVILDGYAAFEKQEYEEKFSSPPRKKRLPKTLDLFMKSPNHGIIIAKEKQLENAFRGLSQLKSLRKQGRQG
ncbi:MAG: ATP-grasp domain-containing protein [Candidatus Ranarchaeia archaeon]